MTVIHDENDRYFLFDNTNKMTVIHRIQKISVILVLNDQNDRYTKSEIIGNFA